MDIPKFDVCPFCGRSVKARAQFMTNCVYVACENGCTRMDEDINAHTEPLGNAGLISSYRFIDEQANAFQAAYSDALQRLAAKWNRRSGKEKGG